MTGMIVRARGTWVALCGAVLLSACASGAKLGEERAELGDFFLSHAIVVAEDAAPIPGSRAATPEQWEEVLTTELRRRFDRYDGDTLYHLGVKVHGYMLAPPGIPLVLSPRSVLGITVDVWDDAAGEKLNARPHQIIVSEAFSAETVVGSGNTQSAEVQMQNLAENVVAAIERWLASNPDWFPPRGAGAPEGDAQAQAQAAPDAGADPA